MVKKVGLIIFSSFLFLSGCLPIDNLKPEEIVKDEGEQEETAIISPEINTHENYYQSLLKYESGAARGEIVYGADNRHDVDELETGLMRLAQDTFDVEDFYFQEGQYVTRETIRNWLGRSNVEAEASRNQLEQIGLNPPIAENYNTLNYEGKLAAEAQSPKFLSYVLEQNYLVDKTEDAVQLGGIAIGLSFHPTYSFQVMDEQGLLHPGQVDLVQSEIESEAKEMGEEVVRRLRQHPELQEIPIVVGLYLEKAEGAVVPGNYFLKAVVSEGDRTVDKWEPVDERYYYFPSDQATEDHRGDSQTFNLFRSEIQDYFPNFIGVIGKGFYRDGRLVRLSIEIPMEFRGKAEVITFTQFVNYLVMKYYPNDVVRVYISSSLNKPESIIINDPRQGDPVVHIYQ